MRNVIISMFVATACATLLSLGLFYFVTVVLTAPYIAIVGSLIHDNADTNRALLHLVSQGSVMGSLGGTLFVFQLITQLVASKGTDNDNNVSAKHAFIYALIIPIKGLIAGIVGTTIVGGVVFISNGLEGLAASHLFVLGCASIAGYSEHFLQRIVKVADMHLPK